MYRNSAGSYLAVGSGRQGTIVVVWLALSAFTGCGSNLQPAVAIKAAVSGLKGSGLELWVNGHDPVPVTADGAVTLAYMAGGYHYSVTVKTQPSNPAQTCTVANATGVVGAADVTDVTVNCVTSYAIGGTVSGLDGSGLVLHSSLGDDLPILGDGPFVFATRTAAQTDYTITVKTQPTSPKQICSVENGIGTVSGTDTRNILVTCVSFVIVGADVAATSPDGIHWDQRTIPAGRYNAVIWNGSVFIAIGDNIIASSLDGIRWESETIAGGRLHAIAWNGSLFSAVGDNVAATSPDGIHWIQRTVSGLYRGIIWNGVVFVAIGGCSPVPSDCSAIASSSDGDVWSLRVCKAPHDGNYYRIAWDGARLVVGGEKPGEFTNVGRLAVSTDCMNWTVSELASATITSITPGVIASVVWSGSAWLVSGNFDGGYASTDGSAWNWMPYAEPYPIVNWANGRFVAISHTNPTGSSELSTSSDGSAWTAQATLSGIYNAIATVDGY